MYGEASRFAGKNRFGAPRSEAQSNEIAEGMHHRHQPKPAEQKNQRMAQAEVVVDGTDQHQAKDDGEQQAGFAWNDENPALGEDNRQLLIAAKTEQPLPEG